MMLRVSSFRSEGAWCSKSPRVSGGVSFACAQALTQALQPIHTVASYSRPTAALGTGTCSARAGVAPAVTATAAGTPAFAIEVMRSRRVIVATSVLFPATILVTRPRLIGDHPFDGRFIAAAEALRCDPCRAAHSARDRSDQRSRPGGDFSRSAVD